MKSRRAVWWAENALLVVLLALLVIVGCNSCAPVQDQSATICGTVRQMVSSGQMPIPLANQFYAECGPFKVQPK